ncbi:MAG TPA: hypothetical protein VE961_06050 [Pyrinomonadaceae bacterium]|nr:hypothetical protein [Pyrinomonadaceae bacterium]
MQKALAIRLRVVAFDPGNRQFQQDLAYCYEGLANLYSLAGPPEKVIEYSDKAIPLLEGLLKADPTNEDDRAILGNTYTLKSKALGNPVTASLGDVAGAWDYLNKALPILERLADDYPADPEYQRNLGAVYNLASLLSGAKGDEKKSLELNEKAIDIDRRLVNLDPNNSLFKSELAIQTGNAGSTMLKLGDAKGAQEKFKQALAIYESMIAADPNDAATHRNAAVGYRNVGVAIGADDRVEAMKNFSKALDIFAGLAAKDSTNADFRRQWAYTYLALSRSQTKWSDAKSAVDSAQQGIKIEEALIATSPTNVTARTTLALLDRQLGDSHVALAARGKEEWRAAKDAYQKALDIYQDLKNKGTLGGADSSKPDELTKEIAKCDAALAK